MSRKKEQAFDRPLEEPWVVPAEGAQLDERALIAHARAHLAPFKVPRGITFTTVEELPLTTTGEIQKYLLVASMGSSGR